MGYLACLLFTCLASFTIRIIEAQSSCNYTICPTCPYGNHSYRYDWRGCQECYCVVGNTTAAAVPAANAHAANGTVGCPYVMCSSCDIFHYQTYRSDGEVVGNATVSGVSTFPPHPASYWSMSRSSLLSIILNLKQGAQSLLDTAKDTYDHVLHSVIVNDLKKRREAVKEDETKDQVDNKQA